MGRVYLPHEDLAQFECAASDLVGKHSHTMAARFRPLLEFEGQRARELYQAGDALLPLIDEDGRPALWVLVTIYRQLLEKIAARNYDVFSEKVRLTTLEKVRVLTKGIWLRLWVR
jgi:phytoene synthase